MTEQKLYTEEQVRILLDKMSLVTERKNLGVSANFRHRAIEIDNLIKSETPIELPSDEEIYFESRRYEKYHESMNELESERSAARYHGHMQGAKYVINKIINK